MHRFAVILANVLLILIVAVSTVWGILAIWYQAPFGDFGRYIASGAFGILSVGVLIALFGARRTEAMGVYGAVLAGLVVWWSMIEPPAQANWSPDVARQVTGDFDGDILTLTNVREFEWRANDDYTELWTEQSFDLRELQTVDLFLSYWGSAEMAHFILSFGFSDGRYLAWSIEVRRKVGGGFSPVADFFKSNTLILVASVEQDVVGVRSNVRDEDVQMFRLRTPPDVARTLLEEYVMDANNLAKQPVFYNSLTTNCTTVVFRMMKAIGRRIPADWRVIVNGYLPDYLYENKAVNTNFSLSELRSLGRITQRAKEVGLSPAFSSAIREGVPDTR